MKSDLGAIYKEVKELYKEYKILHSNKKGEKVDKIFLELWTKAKQEHKSKQDLLNYYKNVLKEIRQKISLKKSENVLYNFVIKEIKTSKCSK